MTIMKIKSLLTTAAILIMTVVRLNAAPLQNIERILTQPDGTILHCFISGDEFYNRLHDADGYTIVQAPNGFFVYATTDENGNIIPTEHIAGKTNPKTLNIKAGITISQKEYLERRESMKLSSIKNRSNLNHGVYNNLVVYIKFNGDADLTTTKTKMESMLNSEGYFDESMNNFFKKITYNKLSMKSYSFPQPDGEQLVAYEDIYPRSYYLPYNESTNPTGYVDHADRSARQFALLKRAIEHISDEVPSHLDIDRNDDGLVDNVIFVVKGNVSAWGTMLWPHCWEMGEGYDAYINGKKVYKFNFQLETSSEFTVSALCHEMGHSLGLPDLYHYSEAYSYLSPVGSWDVMCSNTRPPQHTSTYIKYMYGTWIDEIPTIDYGTYTIEANSWEGGRRNCYKIQSPHPDQYYVIEYRNNNAFFEKTLPGGGLLIYRIDSRYSGCINYDGETIFDEVYLFRPGGDYMNDGNINNAAFCEENAKTEFNHTTSTVPFLNKNTIDEEINICNISAKGNNMTFTYCPINTEIIPKNLTVNVKSKQQYVELSWDLVENADSYNIYRDGTLLMSNIKNNYFQDKFNSIADGYHTYYVTSKSNGTESYRSNEEYVIIGDCCEYIINMTTSDENGWQGGEIRLASNNNIKDSYHTIYSGTEAVGSAILPTGIEMSLYWLSGWDDSKCSFTIKGDNETIYSSSELKEGLLKTFTTNKISAVPPRNLTATTVNAGVRLNWTSNVETESFSIMRDGEIIAEDITDCTYTDNSIPYSGTFEYRVMGNNKGHRSTPSDCVSASALTLSHEDMVLESETNGDNVVFTWNAPALDEGVFRYDDGIYSLSLGSNNYNWAIRIPASCLPVFEETEISSVEIYDNYDGKYNFRIYNGDVIHDSTLIYSEEFTTTASNEFVRFELSEKVPFNADKDIWIAPKASGGKTKPIPCGEFNGNPNSNMIKKGTNWESATEHNMPYSWLLRAYTTAPDNYELTYNVYRNNEVVASELTTTTFTDVVNSIDKTCYNVQAIYNGNAIIRSNNVCFNNTDGFDENYYKKIDIYPNPVRDILHIDIENIRNITLMSITGNIVCNEDVNSDNYELDVQHLNNGIYILKVSTSTETITEKIVVY